MGKVGFEVFDSQEVRQVRLHSTACLPFLDFYKLVRNDLFDTTHDDTTLTLFLHLAHPDRNQRRILSPPLPPLPTNMAPIAIDEHATNGHDVNNNTNGSLNAKAATFTPAAAPSSTSSTSYHAATSQAAMSTEAAYAAHNYHLSLIHI